ncbi:MAG: lecithin retinol acyltransferase family protein [Selenomonadaceae bacterium]|nr:lecithin retinol acyltransferase family protein [Selenomonadaceae bacterium]
MQEPITLDELLEQIRNDPNEETPLTFPEECLIRLGSQVVSGLSFLLLALDTFNGDERIMNKDERRELERILKTLSPDFGKKSEQLNNFQDSVVNPLKAQEEKINALPLPEAYDTFQKGDHIAVDRDLYSHHAIYDGEGNVVEYDDFIVKTATLEDFAKGARIYKVEEGSAYAPKEIMERAYSRIGEQEYDLLFNNCENFATWCRLG